MAESKFMQKVTDGLSKAKFGLQKHSPEILIFAGIVGGIVSTVLACKETLRLDDVIEPAKEDLDRIHEEIGVGKTIKGEEYTKKDAEHDTVIIYVRTGLDLVKLYSPAIAIGALSIASVLASNNILRKRSAELAAAYMAVSQSYKEYRKRVVDKFGEDTDKELKYGVKIQKSTETIEDEDGKKKKVKNSVETIDPDDVSGPYTFFFDASSRNWEKNTKYNEEFLTKQQDYWSDRLKAVGHVFLNEILKELDIAEVSKGNIVGWIWDPDNPNIDNEIDFGIFETHDRNGDPVILLDFNVDGPIIDDFMKYDWRNRDYISEKR